MTNAWKTRCLDWGGGSMFNLGLFGALSSASVRDQSRANPNILTFLCLLPSVCTEHWLSWRPCTMCCGGCWNKGEPRSSSDTRVGTAAFSKWKMGNCFSPFCASSLPLSQLCHCGTKKFPGTEKTMNLFPESYERLLRTPSSLCPCLFFYSGWWLL